MLLADLAAAGAVDLVLLNLHGAMASQSCDDCEGELVERVRSLVGPGVTIGSSSTSTATSPTACWPTPTLSSSTRNTAYRLAERAVNSSASAVARHWASYDR